MDKKSLFKQKRNQKLKVLAGLIYTAPQGEVSYP